MSESIKDRMEVLFLYETKDCNPNGDPLDENKPRTTANASKFYPKTTFSRYSVFMAARRR
ncbi:MAG: hypothetical protein FVQ80_17875, partial [Planctomycetes bacterium]|nr:hypothetical protein [Planctomycetota bacterium]